MSFFAFKRTRNLFFGVNRLLKECLWFMSSDENRKTDAVRTGSAKEKIFEAVMITVLCNIKQFLSDAQK